MVDPGADRPSGLGSGGEAVAGDAFSLEGGPDLQLLADVDDRAVLVDDQGGRVPTELLRASTPRLAGVGFSSVSVELASYSGCPANGGTVRI